MVVYSIKEHQKTILYHGKCLCHHRGVQGDCDRKTTPLQIFAYCYGSTYFLTLKVSILHAQNYWSFWNFLFLTRFGRKSDFRVVTLLLHSLWSLNIPSIFRLSDIQFWFILFLVFKSFNFVCIIINFSTTCTTPSIQLRCIYRAAVNEWEGPASDGHGIGNAVT